LDIVELKRKLEPVLYLAPDVGRTLADDRTEISIVEIQDRIIPVDLVECVVGFDTHLELESLVQPEGFAQRHIGLRRARPNKTIELL